MRNPRDKVFGGAFGERYRFVLAALPALAVVATGMDGLIVGVGVLMALAGTNLLMSALWRPLGPGARPFAYVLFAATLASMADMILTRVWPRAAASSGLYIVLVALNCALIGLDGVSDPDRKPASSLLRALCGGVSYLALMVLIGCAREALGAGALFGRPLGDAFQPMRMVAMTPGGFILAGVVLAVGRRFVRKGAKGGEGA